ncbi:uncharacterized protein LOC133863127 [Alnus glutinosa]|uniref:uncharacterized protein LOC133863127 n=1 Tax=Alnus glutinosa TaxID=3517 RepID=UPI002D786EF2|nr:uncharacterized protein LOC133863127 [Alnus glutinosa]
MAPKKTVPNAPATSRARTKRSDGSVDLSPLESRVNSIIFAKHESVLRSNYEISPTVKLFYQAPGTRVIDGGDVTLYERMFLAGLRLPFPEIARDFVLFLMIAPSQIMPNAWRVKAEKFEEVDFDNLVTEENLRQFLGYNIPRDKQLITKRGSVKKRNDAPPSPRPATKKRSTKNSEEVLGDVPAQKKQKIPLAASGARRTPPSAPSPRVNVEEGSASFRGFIPEVSPAPSFVLRDESSSEASFHGEQCAEPERSGEGEGNVPEAQDIPVARRVKHPARKRKFTAQDRMAQRLADAERMWGKVVITPSDAEEVCQEPLASSGESLEEMDEEVATPRAEALVEESEVEGTPRTPSSERPETPTLPEENREMGHTTPQVQCSAPVQTETSTGVPEAEDVAEPSAFQEAVDQEVPGSASEVRDAGQPEITPRVEVLEEPRIDSENVIPEAGVLPETSTRAEVSPSGLRPDGSEAAPSVGAEPHLLVKMTALWQKYENRPAPPPTPSPEVQARISGLENEVATLKSFLQSKDEELASRDSIISEMRSANARLRNEVLEANDRYTRSVASLSSELDRADQLSIRLSAVQNECSEACKNALNAEAEKDKLKDEVERLAAERDKAVKAQDHSESLLIRLRTRYDADRAKLKRYLKQLSYAPHLRDHSWSRGFDKNS